MQRFDSIHFKQSGTYKTSILGLLFLGFALYSAFYCPQLENFYKFFHNQLISHFDEQSSLEQRSSEPNRKMKFSVEFPSMPCSLLSLTSDTNMNKQFFSLKKQKKEPYQEQNLTPIEIDKQLNENQGCSIDVTVNNQQVKTMKTKIYIEALPEHNVNTYNLTHYIRQFNLNEEILKTPKTNSDKLFTFIDKDKKVYIYKYVDPYYLYQLKVTEDANTNQFNLQNDNIVIKDVLVKGNILEIIQFNIDFIQSQMKINKSQDNDHQAIHEKLIIFGCRWIFISLVYSILIYFKLIFIRCFTPVETEETLSDNKAIKNSKGQLITSKKIKQAPFVSYFKNVFKSCLEKENDDNNQELTSYQETQEIPERFKNKIDKQKLEKIQKLQEYVNEKFQKSELKDYQLPREKLSQNYLPLYDYGTIDNFFMESSNSSSSSEIDNICNLYEQNNKRKKKKESKSENFQPKNSLSNQQHKNSLSVHDENQDNSISKSETQIEKNTKIDKNKDDEKISISHSDSN